MICWSLWIEDDMLHIQISACRLIHPQKKDSNYISAVVVPTHFFVWICIRITHKQPYGNKSYACSRIYQTEAFWNLAVQKRLTELLEKAINKVIHYQTYRALHLFGSWIIFNNSRTKSFPLNGPVFTSSINYI